MIKQYDSISDLRADYLKLGANKLPRQGDNNWYNYESAADTLRLTEMGDTGLVNEAEKLLNLLDANIQTPRHVWQRSPAGAFSCVPDILAGLPTPMRRRVEEKQESAPISIYVCGSSSGSVNANMLSKRGTTILALVMILARTRAVNLHVMHLGNGAVDGTGETVITAKINTSPLDLATACYVLTSAGFTRDILYHTAIKLGNGYSFTWPNSYNTRNPDAYCAGLKARLGVNEKSSLILPGASIADPMITNPISWVNDQIARFNNLQESV